MAHSTAILSSAVHCRPHAGHQKLTARQNVVPSVQGNVCAGILKDNKKVIKNDDDDYDNDGGGGDKSGKPICILINKACRKKETPTEKIIKMESLFCLVDNKNGPNVWCECCSVSKFTNTRTHINKIIKSRACVFTHTNTFTIERQ